MPEDIPITDGKVEVAQPVITEGSIQFMNKAAFKNPAPARMSRIIKALNYFIAAMVTAVGATDLFTGKQAKIICFVLGAVIIGLGSLEIAFGVKTEEK